MSKIVDALGKPCPIPVVMTKKVMDQGEESIVTKVDNKIAVENLKRLGDSSGYVVNVKEEEDVFQVVFSKTCKDCEGILEELESKKMSPKADYGVFIGRETIGEGEEELGRNLMRMFFYTLTESEELPSHIMFMNGGVRLLVEDEQVIDHIKVLKEKGVNILVCGTCLNFYGISDRLQIGTVSNMYDIVSVMQSAGKIISF